MTLSAILIQIHEVTYYYYYFVLFRLTTGACVELQGALIASPGKEQSKELQVNHIKVLGECDTVRICICTFILLCFELFWFYL